MVSNFIDLLWSVFDAFYVAGQTLVSFIGSPLIPASVTELVEPLIPVNNPLYQFLQIESLSEITVLWGLAFGFAGYIIYAIVKWILDIIL